MTRSPARSRLITPAEWVSQPWKNGLGVTHEVWRSPPRDPASAGAGDAYDVRVSVAEDTTPAAFSTFPGYRRWSVLLEPAPITLSIDGRLLELACVGDVAEHDGAAEVHSTALPAGPTKLLNVLAKPGIDVGVISPQRDRRDLDTFTSDAICFLFSIGESPDLPRMHARVFEPPVRLPMANMFALWIRIGARRLE